MKQILFALVLAAACGAQAEEEAVSLGAALGSAKPAFAVDSSAVDILAACRRMLPSRPVELKGALVLRSRRGIVQAEYGYTLVMDRSKVPSSLVIDLTPRDGTNVLEHLELKRPGPVPAGRVKGTDVKWLDLSLDYLWWKDPVFEAEREGETVHGQTCSVILVSPPEPIDGVKAVRLWVDRKTGCPLQAEELDGDMKARRRMWGSRVKKFGNRWMANVLEVETLGSGHRTKITVEELREL